MKILFLIEFNDLLFVLTYLVLIFAFGNNKRKNNSTIIYVLYEYFPCFLFILSNIEKNILKEILFNILNLLCNLHDTKRITIKVFAIKSEIL